MAEVKVDTGKAQENVNNLQKEMRKLLMELRNLESGSEEFVKLSEKVGELQDKINDAGEAARANAGPAFERLGNNFGLVTQKLSSLDLGGAAESMRALGSSIKGISIKEFISGIGSIGSALGALGKALLANPIFLLAAAITAVVMNLDTLRKLLPSLDAAITGVSVELTKALSAQEKLTQSAKDQLDFITRSENSLRLRGLSEKQILQYKQQETKEVIFQLQAQQRLQEQIAMSQIEGAKRNRDILAGVLEWIAAPLRLLLTQVDYVGKALGQEFGLVEGFQKGMKSVAELVFDPDDMLNKAKQTSIESKKALEDLKNQYDGYQLSIKAIDKAAAAERQSEADKAKAKAEKEAAEKLALEQRTQKAISDANNERLNEEERIAEEIFQADMTAQEREIQAIRDAYFEKIELAKQHGLEYNILINEQNKAEEEINKKYRDAEDAAIKASNEKKKKEEQEILQAKFQMASDAMNALSSLNDALAGDSEKSAKRAFKINKALSLAQAIMSTYQAVNAQLAVPQNALTGTAFIKAGIALAAGIANVIKIQKTKFEGGGGGGSSAPSGGGSLVSDAGGNQSTATPAFNVLDTGFLSDRPAQGSPVQAYVLSSDVSSSLEASQKVQSLTVL
jgi:hypothetical protein